MKDSGFSKGNKMPHTKRAFDGLENLLPFFKEKCGEFNSYLYVGWRPGDTKPWWHDWLAKNLNVSKIGVLEIFSPNVAALEHEVWSGRYNVDNIILGDIRNIDKLVDKNEYDVIFLDHMVEHISYDDLNVTTKLLQDHVNKLLIYACPWGIWVQGPEGGNEHEEHKNYVYTEQLANLGMTVLEYGKVHQQGEGELIAYWFKE